MKKTPKEIAEKARKIAYLIQELRNDVANQSNSGVRDVYNAYVSETELEVTSRYFEVANRVEVV